MKKLKDFIYDQNDIIIALLVLVGAALIIIWRMNAIMEYPQQLFTAANNSTSQQGETGDTKQPDQNITADSQDGKDNNSQGKGQTDDGAGTNNQTVPLWSNGVLSKDVEVNVQGTNASDAVNCLVTAGLFEDYAEYEKTCKSAGLDHEKVSAGLFTFKKGYTKEDVAGEINWG